MKHCSISGALVAHAEAGHAIISVYANDPDQLKDEPPALVSTVQQSVSKHVRPFRELISKNQTNWSVIAAAETAFDGVACSTTGSGVFVDDGFNVDSRTSCGFSAAGSIQNGNADLAPLADNGGQTQTRVPSPVSTAVGVIPSGTSATIGGASVALCPRTDQRGFTRPAGLCDAEA